MYWPSQIWGTGPIPSSKKVLQKAQPDMEVAALQRWNCGNSSQSISIFKVVEERYILFSFRLKKNIYLQDPLIKEYQWQHFCKVSVFGWKRWTRTVETWWTIWTRTRFWVSLSCSVVVRQVGWKASDLDLIEANEAFAAQALAVNKVGLAGEGRFEGVHL